MPDTDNHKIKIIGDRIQEKILRLTEDHLVEVTDLLPSQEKKIEKKLKECLMDFLK